MSQVIQTASVSAPGFFGLNTQDSPLDLASGFALVATNCIIDQFGRIGAREGFSRINSSSGALGANDVTVMHELVQADGTLTILFAGANKLFKLDSSNAVSELTYGGGGTAPTITASNWSVASLNGITYFFQESHDPLIFDPAVSTTTYRRVSEKSGYAGTVPLANIVISAYGRLWVADTSTDNVTITFSDLLSGHVWTGGSSGSLNINTVWPNGADNITGLAAHNNFLIIFGARQILVYTGANNPAGTSPVTFLLADSVGGIGCIARDSIQQTGKDVLFLSNSGVRSFARTIIEKSLPVGDLSKNVRNDLIQIVSGEDKKNIKSVYSETKAFYLLTLPSVSEVYCFDTRGQLEDGSFRLTRWDSIAPTSLLSRRNGDVLIGKNGFVCKYGTYQDHTSAYRLMYFTNHADLGNQNVTSLLKRIKVVVIGGSNQSVTVKFGFDFAANYQAVNAQIPTQSVSEYGLAEYGANGSPVAQYADGVALQTLSVPASGSGKIVQTGYESNINGSPLSIQRIEIQSKDGKIA
jgi:hypothetical protein